MTDITTERVPTIYELMARVLADLPAIGKNQRNAQQGFNFRGIDDVLNALNPLLAKHGVFYVPDVVERLSDERPTAKGGVMYVVHLHVRYRFYGPAGDYVEASGWGEGTDSGDKATNKAMTGAMKYVLFQSFAISTDEAAENDSDRHAPEPTVARRQVVCREPDCGEVLPSLEAKRDHVVEFHGWVRQPDGKVAPPPKPEPTNRKEAQQEPNEKESARAGHTSGAEDHRAAGGAGAPPEATADGPPMTTAQRSKLFALLNERGIKGDTERRAWAAQQLGLSGGVSFTTLTKAATARLIDALSAEQGQ